MRLLRYFLSIYIKTAIKLKDILKNDLGEEKVRVILHVDLNNFYASVEMKLNPSLEGKFIGVCGNAENRHGIILAKSENAKKMGVKPQNCAIVGDQLLTDILGGNLAGVKTILVTPTLLETSRGFKIKRAIERKLLKLHHLKCNF